MVSSLSIMRLTDWRITSTQMIMQRPACQKKKECNASKVVCTSTWHVNDARCELTRIKVNVTLGYFEMSLISTPSTCHLQKNSVKNHQKKRCVWTATLIFYLQRRRTSQQAGAGSPAPSRKRRWHRGCPGSWRTDWRWRWLLLRYCTLRREGEEK